MDHITKLDSGTGKHDSLDNFQCKNHIVLGLEQHLHKYEDKLQSKPRKIMILNTGGTISMFPSERGYVTKKNQLQQFMRNNPYLCDIDYTYFKVPDGEEFLITPESVYHRRIWYKVFELEPLLDSSNMNPVNWFQIAHFIQKEYKNFDGFIVLHGTDTMAYTASALSFMFQNLTKTVVLTGSQIPLSQPRNDGFQNLLNAITLAGHFTIPEVLITFYDKLLRGNRTQKVNSNDLDSFESPKYRPLAKFAVHIDINWDLITQDKSRKDSEHLVLTEELCSEVASIRMTPFLNTEGFNLVFSNKLLKGLVIETYGAGNLKTDKSIFEEIKGAAQRGIVIVNISQCFNSKVQMLYETGIIYDQIGVIQGSDMTMEAAVTKLSYLLGRKDLNHSQIKEQMEKNLRGELTPISYENKFDIQNEPFLQELSSLISDGNQKGLNDDIIMPNILCLMCKQRMNAPNLANININVKAIDYDGKSILHVGAREGAYEIVKCILENGGEEIVNAIDRFQHSALFEAVRYRHLKIIQLLVNHKGALIAPDKELTHILMKAVNEDDIEILEYLYLANIRDFTKYQTIDKRTLGHLAISKNSVKVIKFLRRSDKHQIIFDWNSKDRWNKLPNDYSNKID